MFIQLYSVGIQGLVSQVIGIYLVNRESEQVTITSQQTLEYKPLGHSLYRTTAYSTTAYRTTAIQNYCIQDYFLQNYCLQDYCIQTTAYITTAYRTTAIQNYCLQDYTLYRTTVYILYGSCEQQLSYYHNDIPTTVILSYITISICRLYH